MPPIPRRRRQSGAGGDAEGGACGLFDSVGDTGLSYTSGAGKDMASKVAGDINGVTNVVNNMTIVEPK